eukprot:jgi/Astpho2/2712/Aster-00899
MATAMLTSPVTLSGATQLRIRRSSPGNQLKALIQSKGSPASRRYVAPSAHMCGPSRRNWNRRMMDPFQIPMMGPMSGAISWELGPNGWSAKQHKSNQQQNLWFPVSASCALKCTTPPERCQYLQVDVEETRNSYRWYADVPGLTKDNIQVQVSRERELTISGHRQRATAETAASQPADQEGVVDVGSSDSEADSKDAGDDFQKSLQRERRFGSFKRSWSLPEDADVSAIRASVQHGILSLTISKTKPSEPEVTSIPIN